MDRNWQQIYHRESAVRSNGFSRRIATPTNLLGRMKPYTACSTIRIIFAGLLGLCLLAACRTPPAGLSHPTGVAVAADGSLYVMDHTVLKHSRVVHITPQGKILNAFQPENPGPGLVNSGWDVAVGPTGNVYYCNLVFNEDRTVHDGLMAFNPNGAFLYEIGAADYPLDTSRLAAVPYNLDIDNRGWIYVADFNYNQLRVFDSQGQLRTTLRADNAQNFNFSGIGDVAVDDRRSLLYLTDFFEGRLEQYRFSIQTNGSIRLVHQFSLGAFGHGPGELAFPQYLAVDENTGIVYVGDMGNRRIVAYDPQGNYVNEFSPPVDDWQVLGLAVGAETGPSADAEHPADAKGLNGPIIYAADALNQVIWAFGPDGQVLRKIEVH
jgi:DNA-binding beta-propeller fold protein YncE